MNNGYREIIVGWFGTWNSLNALGGIIFTQNAFSLMLGFIVVTIINLIFIKYEKARTENLSLVNFMDFIFTQRDRTNARLSKLDEVSRVAGSDMKSYLNELERIIKNNRCLMVYPKEKSSD